MGLSNDLISQFAKITNDQKVSRIDEVTLYGEVVKCEDTIYVKFDGSQELTPVTTVTERDEEGNITNFKYGAASVKTGDRVSVLLKNHSATITGNLSDPPMGRAEVKINDDSIIAKVGEDIKVQIDALGVKINGLTTFTNTTATKLDNLTDGLSRGETIIDGGCIKTGLIDAERISLKGLIVYEYSVDGINDWHYPMAAGDMFRRESIDGGNNWGDPYQFVGKDGKDGQNGSDGSDANVPSYIEIRGIDFTDISNNYIKSPKIYGGEFYGNTFNVIAGSSSGSFNLYGDDNSETWHMFTIQYENVIGPNVLLYSPCGASIKIGDNYQGNISFRGFVSFAEADVSGITATFA